MECNPTVKDIYDVIDGFAPFASQCEWDNSGLLVGSGSAEVKKIGVVLDITAEAVEAAHSLGVDAIVSHHPVIFRPISSIPDGSAAYLLVKYGIAAVCAHTSLDKAVGGVNDTLAAKLGFLNAAPLFECGDESMIRAAEIPVTDARSLAELTAEKLGTAVALADAGKPIKKVALCGGAAGDFISAVISAGCDAYITGEAKHHEFIECKERGLSLLAAGHFATENPVVQTLAAKLSDELGCETVVIEQSAPEKYIK